MDRPATATTVTVSAALAVTLLAVLLTRLLPLLDPADPWIDEAMLMANLPLRGPDGLLRPLPLFEQAGPLGYIALAHAAAALFPEAQVTALRALSVAASLAGAGLVYAGLRRLTPAAGLAVPLAMAFVALTPFTIVYSLEIKHYIFEYLASALVFYAAVRVAVASRRDTLALFGAAGLLAILFAFSAPVTIAAATAGIVVQWLAVPGRSLTARLASLLPLGLVAAGLAAVFGLYYLGYTKPVTAYQFSSYAHVYETSFLVFPPLTAADLSLWARIPAFLAAITGFDLGGFPSKAGLPDTLASIVAAALQAVLAIVLVAGLLVTARRAPLVAAAFVTALAFVVVLSLAQVLPIFVPRHFAFLVPLAGIVAGFGLVAVLSWLAARFAPGRAGPVTAGLAWLALAGLAALGALQAATLERQALTPLIARIVAEDAAAPVWVYYGAQPAMRVLAPDDLRRVGLVPHESSEAGWIWAHRDRDEGNTNAAYMADTRQALAGLPEVWLVFSHYWVETDGLAPFIDIAEAEIGGCRKVLALEGTQLWKCGDAG